VNKPKKDAVGNAVNASGDPIWERLNVEKEKKDKIAEEKEKRSKQRELAACTFKPQIKCVPWL
jgi:hypothetical protein